MNVDRSTTRLSRVALAKSDPVVDPRDQLWEYELLTLLIALETLRTRLHERCEAGLAVAALDTMLDMIRCLSDFVEARELREEREELEERMELVRTMAGLLRNRLSRSPWQQMMRLFSPPSEEDPRLQFVASAEWLFDVLSLAFELFLGRFQSPKAAQDWNEARQAFLADLGGLIDLLQP